MEFIVRTAESDDAANILGLLFEVAPEIPLRTDGTGRQNLLRDMVRSCCDSNESLVALSRAGQIVGFQITRPSGTNRVFTYPGDKQQAGLMLEYAAVSAPARGNGILGRLIEKTKLRRLPLYAKVAAGNRSEMPKRLEKLGFSMFARDEQHQYFRYRGSRTYGS